VFCATTLPAINIAAQRLIEQSFLAGHPVDVRLVVHTDCPEQIMAGTQLTCDPRPIPAGLRDFDCMSQAHREALAMACRGDVVSLMTADAVPVAGALAYAAAVLENPQMMIVMCAAMRALEEGHIKTTEGPEFMAWAWAHRHPITEQTIWPEGHAGDLSRMHFTDGEAVTTRMCLPHPLAVRIDGRPLAFTPTVDVNLMQCFHHSEMHLAPRCDECALVELSPRSKTDNVVTKTIRERLRAGELRIPDPLQRWCLNQRVIITGPDRDCGDEALSDHIQLQHGGVPR
jgi:hypothetical protein